MSCYHITCYHITCYHISILDVGQRITVFYGDFIKVAIVYAESLCFICLLNQHDRASPRANAGFNDTVA